MDSQNAENIYISEQILRRKNYHFPLFFSLILSLLRLDVNTQTDTFTSYPEHSIIVLTVKYPKETVKLEPDE